MRYTFFGEIKNGELILDNQYLVKEAISRCKNTRVEIRIQKESEDVSQAQWKYLYASIYKPFGDYYGWTVYDVDTWMKDRFMEENLIKLPGGLRLTKTCFDRMGLAKYIDSCIRYAAEEGIVVEPPNPQWKEDK